MMKDQYGDRLKNIFYFWLKALYLQLSPVPLGRWRSHLSKLADLKNVLRLRRGNKMVSFLNHLLFRSPTEKLNKLGLEKVDKTHLRL